jgi:type IV pilus assembly protein PilX
MMRGRTKRGGRNGGIALIVVLVVLAAVLGLGVSAARAALNAERAARYERDHLIALQAAEAALHDAQRDIEGGGNPLAPRAQLFHGAAGFVEGCGRGAEANAGLCSSAGTAPAWLEVDLAEQGADARAVAYGTYTGARMATGSGSLPCCLPRYVIEPLAIARAGDSAGARDATAYRITAIGFGTAAATQVVLQTVYRSAAP